MDKSWKINDALLNDFFPYLVPGRSVIVHQDYGWGSMPWIPITMELLADSVRWVDGMKAGSHVFYLERELPTEVLRNGVLGLRYEEKLRLMESAIERRDGWTRGMLELSRATLIADQHGSAAGLEEVADVAEQHSDPYVLTCLEYVRDALQTDSTAAGVRHGQRITSR